MHSVGSGPKPMHYEIYALQWMFLGDNAMFGSKKNTCKLRFMHYYSMNYSMHFDDFYSNPMGPERSIAQAYQIRRKQDSLRFRRVRFRTVYFTSSLPKIVKEVKVVCFPLRLPPTSYS